MKAARLLSTAAAFFLVTPGFAQAKAPDTVPDTVFVNGQVYTGGGWAEALAIGDGKIIATGTNAAVRTLADSHTRIVDLNNRTVLPGLADMHVHPPHAGMAALECRIAQGADATTFLNAVSACVKAKQPGQWITGGQWQAASIGDASLNKAALDRVSPDNPVVLVDISGHSYWANSKALQIAGITRDTPNPTGGIIERDAAGEPTGILRENAKDLVQAHVPPPTAEQTTASLKIALDILLSEGVTTLTDALLVKETLLAYDALADRGELKQNVVGCITYKRAPDFEDLIAHRQSYARPNFRPECVKVFMDGVPTDSHTAAMLEPYAGGQHNAPPRGILLIGADELNPAVTRWDKLGLTVKFHAVGDWAVRTALDAVEAARKANGPNGPHHEIGHLTFVSPEDIGRATALNATWEFSPYLWYPTVINEDITKAIGPDRLERVWPLREGFASGANVIAGSDWPVVPDGNPWLAIETSITRKAPGGSGEAFGGGEAITLQQAFDMFTINAARQMGEADKRGSLEAGKIADFIVTDKNPFKIPVTEIHTVQVQQTYTGGEKVFDRSPQ
ncbi:MAG TPA: amidohydrolase [Sphingomonadaceae bacterium]|nr:amidohydrolase [Sphingomonadaceae bacterium]